MSSTTRVTSSIARRFVLYIILFSSVITLAITSVQLYRDYNTDIALIHLELDQINSVHLSSLTSALWTFNQRLLQTNIEGIVNIRDIQYVEIRDEDKVWATAGEIKGQNNIQRSYVMSYSHRNKNINIGTLTVNVSLDGVYQRLVDKVWVILITNGIKTALVAIFIYFLFYHLIARHLTTISQFSEKHQTLSDNALLILKRRKKEKTDEFDTVVQSINNMHARLNEQVSEIEKQKQHLFQTLNSIGDAVVTTDEHGNVTRLNPVAEKLTGWTNAEAFKKPLKTIFPIVDATTRKQIPNPVDEVLSTGQTVYLSNHTTLISKDGTEHQIADSAAPIRDAKKILGMVLVFNDVTAQYQLRQELQESEKQLRLIHKQVPGIVYQFKVNTDGSSVFLYVSPAIEKYLGISPESVINNSKEWFQLCHPDDYASLIDSIDASRKNLTEWNWEGRIVRQDSKTVWLRGTSTPERLKDGSTLWYGLFTDVTEYRMQEEQLRRSQKMDALGKLTGGIAHDYNNILGIVLGYAVQISENPTNTEKVISYAKTIQQSAERGAELAKKMLSFSKNKQPLITNVDINHMLQEDRHMIKNILTAKHELILDLQENLWQVELDSGDLEDAIVNMCINASHAMESKGQLTISTRNETLNKIDAQQLGADIGDYVLLSITDTGCGIDNITKEKIFDPFFSTKGNRGTGLGLSQVYGFVERSNGKIKVYSEKGRGSQFSLYFPKNKKSTKPPKNTRPKDTNDFSGTETLLIVDDEPAMLNLAYEIFTSRGYRVLKANDGKQALMLLHDMARAKKGVDLIISDVIMPNMDGYELAAQVQQDFPKIKIQMVSGFADNRHNKIVDTKLHTNMLHKPYSSNTILKRVRSLLDENEAQALSFAPTIMTLDDDEDVQALYKIKLQKLGYHVITVFNGKEAIDTYKNALKTDKPIDVIIVDLSMPGDLNGNEVTNDIRKIHPQAKIIVASGHSEGPEMTNPQDHGFDAALEKSFNADKMKGVLEDVLAG